MNIFVGNLASDVNEDDLKELFSRNGKVDKVKIIRDMFSQVSKGFGFIEMPGRVESEKALKELNNFEFKGKRLTVNEARPQMEKRNTSRRRY